jgi:VIT1/CCC1 family predicted Fe2+/Mn2+ transporter
MYSLIAGFLLPPVLAIVQQQGWSDQIRAVVAFLACALVGAGVAYFQGDLTGKRVVTGILVVMVTALTTYRNFWKPTQIAPAIEAKTTLG